MAGSAIISGVRPMSMIRELRLNPGVSAFILRGERAAHVVQTGGERVALGGW